jgi:hypothetical protein
MILNPIPILIKYLEKYERHVGMAAILLGFIWDSLTFSNPDQLLGNVILLFYFAVSAFGIILLALYKKRGEVMPVVLLALIQFAFGNIAGSFLFIYGKSGTFEGSSLFLLILGVFLIGNEFLRERYARVNFHISTWYFLSLLYFTFVIPMITGEMGTLTFGIGVASSLVAVSALLLFILYFSSRGLIGEIKKISLSIAGILVLFNILYFTNIIPPVPLSLKEIGIYHLVERTSSGNYKTTYEKPEWFEVFRNTGKTFNRFNNESAYCFSSVYAPVKITTGINHKWEYHNDSTGKWQTSSLVSFPISGGREDGYRGYSQKSGLTPGYWRCSVETNTGALVGRTTFTIVDVNSAPILFQKES